MDVATKMAHFYPNVQWPNLTMRQLTGYLTRIGELYQSKTTPIEDAMARETAKFRIENNL